MYKLVANSPPMIVLTKPCPFCAETIRMDAKEMSFLRRIFRSSFACTAGENKYEHSCKPATRNVEPCIGSDTEFFYSRCWPDVQRSGRRRNIMVDLYTARLHFIDHSRYHYACDLYHQCCLRGSLQEISLRNELLKHKLWLCFS
jgi:hypothetical protein